MDESENDIVRSYFCTFIRTFKYMAEALLHKL